MDALYEKAKAEAEPLIYGGGPTSLYEVPASAFEQKYPGIKVPSCRLQQRPQRQDQRA